MSLFKGASVYLISNILNAIIPFLLLPILTRYLSAEEYGQIAMFQTLLSGIGTFIGVNAVGSANRKYYDSEINNIELKQFNGSCVQILFISSIIAFISFLLFQKQLGDFLAIPTFWILISIVISSATFIITMRLGQWQIRNQAKWFGILQVSNSIINMLLSLILVIFMEQGVQGRVDAQVISGMLMATVALIFMYRDNLLQLFVWKPIFIKEVLKFGIPLIPHHVGFFLISAVDRFIINQKLGLIEAGIYMVAIQLSLAMAVIFDAVNKAYIPWLFERLKNDNLEEKKQIVKYTYYYFLVVFIIALFSFVLGPDIIILIAGDKYKEAGNIIGFLCLGQAFGGMYLMVTNYIFYSKDTGKLSLITFFTGGINIILLIILINEYGILGAAISFSIAKFLQFILTFRLSKKVLLMPW